MGGGSLRFSFEASALPAAAVSMRRRVRAFLDAERTGGGFVPRPNSWMHYDAAFSRRCGEAGFIGITFPKACGGHGGTSLERYVVCEEMLAAGAPVSMHWIADRQSGPQILRHGVESLRRRVIPEIVAGRCCIGIGMSEPGAGSDLAAVRTRATRVDGGWKIDGNKLWTSNAQRAHYLIVLCRTEPAGEQRHAGLTQFLVDMSAPGVQANPITDLTGGQDFNEVSFDGCFVADEQLLGRPGEGWALVNGELAFERSGPERFLSTFPLFPELIGRLRSAPERGSQAEIGRLAAHLATLRHMSIAVAGKLDRGESPSAEAALVKDLGSAFERAVPEAARLLADAMPQPRAREAYPRLLAESMLAVPSFTLRGGTREILRGIVARQLGLR